MPACPLLSRSISFAQITAWLGVLLAAYAPWPCFSAEKLQLGKPPLAGELTHVKVSMLATGQLFLQSEGKKNALDMSVAGKFEYDERLTEIAGERLKAMRDYSVAEAKLKLERGGESPSLRPDRRLISVQIDSTSTTLTSPRGLLSREELDLIDLPANSLLLDQLLPAEPVAAGDHWKHGEALVGRLLNLEAVSFAEAESTLVEASGGLAKLTLSGAAQGAISGVVADLEFRGKYEVALDAHRIVWFTLLIKDKRPIGHVNPGMDVVAKLIVERSGSERPAAAGSGEFAKSPVSAAQPATQLLFEAPGGGYSLAYDRNWFVTTADRGLAVLRLLERGELVAQCNISPLPAPKSSDRQQSISLEDYQAHVKDALGKRFGQFTQATQIEAKDGQAGQIYRVVVQGEQAGLSLRWIYYLVMLPEGERLSLAFTMEDKLVERFGDADRVLVAGLQTHHPMPTQAKAPSAIDGPDRR